jgi:hypothetical protein
MRDYLNISKSKSGDLIVSTNGNERVEKMTKDQNNQIQIEKLPNLSLNEKAEWILYHCGPTRRSGVANLSIHEASLLWMEELLKLPNGALLITSAIIAVNLAIHGHETTECPKCHNRFLP